MTLLCDVCHPDNRHDEPVRLRKMQGLRRHPSLPRNRTPTGGVMTCPHHLWDDPTSYRCTRTDVHDTHAYASRDVADGHDDSERQACA